MKRRDNITTYETGDVLQFGKHKGETIDDVISEHSHWVEWAIENVAWFDISDELMQLL